MGVKGLVTSCEIVLKEVEKDFREKEISEDLEKDRPVIKEEEKVERATSSKREKEKVSRDFAITAGNLGTRCSNVGDNRA